MGRRDVIDSGRSCLHGECKRRFSLIFLRNTKIREHQIKLIETRLKDKKSLHNLASVVLLMAEPHGFSKYWVKKSTQTSFIYKKPLKNYKHIY